MPSSRPHRHARKPRPPSHPPTRFLPDIGKRSWRRKHKPRRRALLDLHGRARILSLPAGSVARERAQDEAARWNMKRFRNDLDPIRMTAWSTIARTGAF